MKFVIDSNIVFSGILNPENKIGKILISGSHYFDFITTYKLKEEILNHKSKILNITNYSELQFYDIFNFIIQKIIFLDDTLISNNNIEKAINLVKDIDPDDFTFIALALELNCSLWTGDKKLVKGLQSKNFKNIIPTKSIIDLYNKETHA